MIQVANTAEEDDIALNPCDLCDEPNIIDIVAETEDPVLIEAVEEAFEEIVDIAIEEAEDPDVVVDVLPLVEELE